MSTRSNIRKRERQRKRFANRPKSLVEPVVVVEPVQPTTIEPQIPKSAELFEELAKPLHSLAFSEAIVEQQLLTLIREHKVRS